MLFPNDISSVLNDTASVSAKCPVRTNVLLSGVSNNSLVKLVVLFLFLSQLDVFLCDLERTDDLASSDQIRAQVTLVLVTGVVPYTDLNDGPGFQMQK